MAAIIGRLALPRRQADSSLELLSLLKTRYGLDPVDLIL